MSEQSFAFGGLIAEELLQQLDSSPGGSSEDESGARLIRPGNLTRKPLSKDKRIQHTEKA